MATIKFKCTSERCGKTFIADPNSGVLKCPYCKRTQKVVGKMEDKCTEGEHRPDPIVARHTAAIAAGTTTPGLDISLMNGRCRCEACKAAWRAGKLEATPTPAQATDSPLATQLKRALAATKAAANPTEEAGHQNLMIIAKAGTGKTTTLIEGLKFVKGLLPSITPSPQQLAIWAAMKLMYTTHISICLAAFNKSIADVLKKRMPSGCDAMSIHGMGLRGLMKAYGKIELDDDFRVPNIIGKLTDKTYEQLKGTTLLNATQQLVALCKQTLAGWDGAALSLGNLNLPYLADFYEVELTDRKVQRKGKYWDEEDDTGYDWSGQVFDLVPQVLEQCLKVEGVIDYDDMIWLPVVKRLPVRKYGMLLVDESQDLNRCQQELVMKSGQRLIFCGDPRQAIYGFAGADCESLERLSGQLKDVLTLPLTVTRRCGKAIVAEANQYEPDFQAHESNPEGKVGSLLYPTDDDGVPRTVPTYLDHVQDGDMILCRCNAPLVSQCLKLIKMGKKAYIQGRKDVAKGLIGLVGKLADPGAPVELLITNLDDWHTSQLSKERACKKPNEAKLNNISDRYACIKCFIDEALNVQDVIDAIDRVFTDNKDSPGVRLSSIHKAKGLEARRVFLLQPKGTRIPLKSAKSGWQIKQEFNLLYVAITRAIEEFYYVN